jgi:hypothetical protein
MARRSADAAVATPTVVASAIWSDLPDDVLLRIFDILVEERFNYDGQQGELEDLCAVRATTTQWLRAAKRTQFWLRTWCTVRESAAWPLRHCVLQLEIQTSNYPFPRPADDEYLETVAIEVPFMSRDIGNWHAVAGSDGWGVVEKARVEGEMLRRYSVVTYARIYHKKTGRACDIQTKEEEPMRSVEFESDATVADAGELVGRARRCVGASLGKATAFRMHASSSTCWVLSESTGWEVMTLLLTFSKRRRKK